MPHDRRDLAIAEDALTRADDVTVTYDSDAGYPTSLEIDWVSNAVDDEASYFAGDLTID